MKRSTRTKTSRHEINYAEKVDEKFTHIEKFVKKWVCVENSICHKERGLMLPTVRGPDWHGKIKDFTVIRCFDKEGTYAMTEVDLVKSIKIDRQLEKKFEQSTPEKQREMLGWLEKGPTTADLEQSWQYRQEKCPQ